MGVSLWNHQHAAIGVEIHFTIEPPFVIPMPVATVTQPAFLSAEKGKVSFCDHEHEVVGIPSLEVTEQQMIGKTFLTHSHEQEGEGIDLEGAFTSTLTFTPPPWSL